MRQEELGDPLSCGEWTVLELFVPGESVAVRQGESFSRVESLALAAGEWDPLERGESVPLERFLLALDRGDSLPLRRGESLPRRRGESLLLLLGDPDDRLKSHNKNLLNILLDPGSLICLYNPFRPFGVSIFTNSCCTVEHQSSQQNLALPNAFANKYLIKNLQFF